MSNNDIISNLIHRYQCPFCDGYEQKDYPIGMLTFLNPSYAHFALMALPFNKDFTIYSNGPVPEDEPTQIALQKVLASGVKLDQRTIRRLLNNGRGPENGITIEFESGSPAKLGMLLHRPPTKNRGQSLIDQLGLETKPTGEVVADSMMLRTNVPGCFAAGDTQELMKQAMIAGSNGKPLCMDSRRFSVSSLLTVRLGVRVGAAIAYQLAEEEGDRALEKQETIL